MTGSSLDEGSELSGSLSDDVAGNEVLNELGEADEREGERDGSEVGDRGTRRGSREPSVGVEALGVEGESVLDGLGLERNENLGGSLGEESGDVGLVDVEERLKLVEVDLEKGGEARRWSVVRIETPLRLFSLLLLLKMLEVYDSKNSPRWFPDLQRERRSLPLPSQRR